MLAGMAAGALEAVVTMPFEVAKTRAQIGQSKNGFALSGIRGMYSGLSFQVVQNAGKVGARFFVHTNLTRLAGEDKRLKALSGVAAGCVESFVWITPCERLKILRVKHSDKPFSVAVNIARQEGFLRLWTGATPTIVRNGATVGLRFYLFDKWKDKYGFGNAAITGAIVGACSTVVNNPIDVIKSEMQAVEGKKRYRSMFDCAKTLFREKGVYHLLTAGLVPRILKIGVGQAVIFQTVEFLNK